MDPTKCPIQYSQPRVIWFRYKMIHIKWKCVMCILHTRIIDSLNTDSERPSSPLLKYAPAVHSYCIEQKPFSSCDTFIYISRARSSFMYTILRVHARCEHRTWSNPVTSVRYRTTYRKPGFDDRSKTEARTRVPTRITIFLLLFFFFFYSP
jgi:hypothetical protein